MDGSDSWWGLILTGIGWPIFPQASLIRKICSWYLGRNWCTGKRGKNLYKSASSFHPHDPLRHHNDSSFWSSLSNRRFWIHAGQNSKYRVRWWSESNSGYQCVHSFLEMCKTHLLGSYLGFREELNICLGRAIKPYSQ